MKTPPDNPEFARFSTAVQDILKVSKNELQIRIEAEKRKPNASASRDTDAASREHQNG
jgi:hypothetical protein